MLGNSNLYPGKTKGNGDLQFTFTQVKGTLEDDYTDADLISCVEFNSNGQLLACGDKGGRIVIFQRSNNSRKSMEYDLYTTFQSHEAEFDYLKSLEIEEKINKIRWLDARKNAANFLLTTNDKTIKLWKLSERDKQINENGREQVAEAKPNCDDNGSDDSYFRDLSELRLPKTSQMEEPSIIPNLRRDFSNAHTFHINSISINSDQETYISADELRINLWNLEVTNESFVIVDIKPANMEDLTEVITAAEFHPQKCNIFAYSTSKGFIKLCDMRQAALCDQYSKIYQDSEISGVDPFYNDLLQLISDLKFTNDGRYMVTRDYMNIKIWDINMEKKPVETYPVHDYMRGKLGNLYEKEYIFDKFECSMSSDDNYILTGSYNLFKLIDRQNKKEFLYEVNPDIIKQNYLRPVKVLTSNEALKKKPKKDEISIDDIQLTKRVFHTSWNPHENLIAVASTKNLYLFSGKQQ